MSHKHEEVLVFQDHILDDLGRPKGFDPLRTNDYLNLILEFGNVHFMRRDHAEENPKFRQLIPYCLLNYEDKLLSYERTKKGGEKRLHSRRSLGIGGHINPIDLDGEIPKYIDVYQRALQRELDEEIIIEDSFTIDTIGVICNDSTEVEKVHFGIVHVINITSMNVHPNDPTVADFKFETFTNLITQRENYEGWSQLIIDEIDKNMTLDFRK